MAKKAASELTFDKIIILILVLLVILAVLMFLFKADIIEKIKNMPGYGPNPDETINLSEDQLKMLNYTAVGSISKSVKSYSSFEQQYFEVYKLNPDYTIAQKIPTRLILYSPSGTSGTNGDIEIGKFGLDIPIGKIADSRVSITVSEANYQNYLKTYNDGSLPDFKTLMQLDKSKYLSGLLQKTKSLI